MSNKRSVQSLVYKWFQSGQLTKIFEPTKGFRMMKQVYKADVEKLITLLSENGVRVAQQPHELQVSRFDSSFSDDKGSFRAARPKRGCR